MATALGTVAPACVGYYWYLHPRFWRISRTETPREYRNHSEFSLIEYTKGTQWIDYALSVRHGDPGARKISRSSEALRKAHGFFESFTGLALAAFSVAILPWALSRDT